MVDGIKVTPQKVELYEWWPGCKGPEGSNVDTSGNTSDITNCGAPCCDCEERDAFREYNSKADFEEVHFPSREGDQGQETVNIVGWWLPAHPQWDNGAAIILVHGLKGTINDFRPALAAYLVRSAGFSVLMPNIRAHGASQAPKHGQLSWGFDSAFDVLGAWDYLRHDPDNKLGRTRDAGNIGIMGFSMGGFIAATAFGLEGQAAALWLDGPVSNPKDILPVLLSTMVPVVGCLIPPLMTEPAWLVTETLAKMNMDMHCPANTLPKGPDTKRPVMHVHGADDADVPLPMSQKYKDLFSALPDKYEVQYEWDMSSGCDAGPGRYETHNMLQWIHPTQYRRLLCKFWSKTLLSKDCNESKLVPLTY